MDLLGTENSPKLPKIKQRAHRAVCGHPITGLNSHNIAVLRHPHKTNDATSTSTLFQELNNFFRRTVGADEFGSLGLHLFITFKRNQYGAEHGGDGGVGWHVDAVVHPLSLAPRRNNAHVSQVSQMAGYFGLALAQDFDKVADADLMADHQVQKAQTGCIGQRRAEASQTDGFESTIHMLIVYGLTNIQPAHIFAWTYVSALSGCGILIRSGVTTQQTLLIQSVAVDLIHYRR
jgi:hypothetical protein